MNLYDSLLEKLDGRQYSNYFSCLCPFHDDNNPSMFVYDDGFRCASCGKRGTLKYLDSFTGSHFRTSLTRSQSKPQLLPRWRKWEQEWGDLEGIANHAHQSLKRYPQFQHYFKKRGINGFIDAGHFGYIMGWNLFPVLDSIGKVVDIIIRSGKGKSDIRYYILPDGTGDSANLYCPSWKRVLSSEVVYVCFGIIDAWAFEAIGLPVVTGTTGKSLSADTLKPLGKQFIIVPDLNEEREAYLLANKLGWRATVKKLKYDDGVKDPDGVRAKFGNDYLVQMIGA